MIDERLSKLTDSEKADRLRLWESAYNLKQFCRNNESCKLPNGEPCPADTDAADASWMYCSFKRNIPMNWDIPKPPTPDFVRCMECTYKDEGFSDNNYSCRMHNCFVGSLDGCTMGSRKEDEE